MTVLSKLFDTTTYDSYGVLLRTGEDTIIYFFRQGTHHYLAKGKTVKQVYTISTNSWSERTDVYDDPNPDYGCLNVSGGIIGSHIFLFIYRYNFDTETIVDTGYIKSTDLTGSSWGAFTSVVAGKIGYGQLVPTADPNTFLQTIYDLGWASRVWKTIDDGDNWAETTPIYTGATQWCETCMCYIGDGKLIALLRDENGGAGSWVGQAVSSDNGASWSAISNTNLGLSSGRKIPWIIYDEELDRVIALYVDRGDNYNLKWAYGDALTIFNDPTAWGNLEVLHSTPLCQPGYPSMVKVASSSYYIVVAAIESGEPGGEADVDIWGADVPPYNNLILHPNDVGDYTNIAYQVPGTGAHWDKVDDPVASPDEATTFVGQNATGLFKDAYELEDTAQTGTIISVKVYFRCWKGSGSTYNYARPSLRLGTEETNGTNILLTNSPATYSETLGRPGGGSWSWADINALQVIIGLTREPTSDAVCTQIYVEVTYTTIVLPTETTDPATDVASNSSTLNGTLDDDGGEACDCGFEWGETVAYGNTTPTESKETGETFSQAISGLDPAKTYHFRAFATNSAGTSYGDDRTFSILGVPSSVSDKRHDEHFMNIERWFGISGDQSGDDWALEAALAAFQAKSGDGDFGGDADDEAKVIGTDDTPVITDKQFFILHKLLVLDASATTAYILRIVYGSDTMANNESAGQYSDVAFIRETGVGRGAPIELKMPILRAGTDKVWIRAKNATDNATIDFLVGLHEHD